MLRRECLIVQGAAGSGKTPIALHRIAFLLYHDAYLAHGYESIGVVCKSQQDATKIFHQLMKYTKVHLVNPNDTTINKGVSILSVYMAKGLEFDAVLVYQASAENYSNELDRKLLYVACTRALHRLSLYYTG